MSIKAWIAKKLFPDMISRDALYMAQARAAIAGQRAVIAEAEELERKFGPGGYWKHKNGVWMCTIAQQMKNEKAINQLLLPSP